LQSTPSFAERWWWYVRIAEHAEHTESSQSTPRSAEHAEHAESCWQEEKDYSGKEKDEDHHQRPGHKGSPSQALHQQLCGLCESQKQR
jgi:hypothetical protein